MSIQSHIVPDGVNKQRLRRYLPGIFTELSTHSACKKAIRNNRIRINGEAADSSSFISGGEKIDLAPEPSSASRKPYPIRFPILYEDDYLACINKPAGISSSGNKHRTIENALPLNLNIEQDKHLSWPHIIHRLDYPTSGILLVGKTMEAVQKLNKAFAEGHVLKSYCALTCGPMDKEGAFDIPVENKQARTSYKILKSTDSEKYDRINLLEVIPATGRRHQIRQHLSAAGYPVLGDKKYGNELTSSFGSGLYLHAVRLCFTHPQNMRPMDIYAPVPAKFNKIYKDESRT